MTHDELVDGLAKVLEAPRTTPGRLDTAVRLADAWAAYIAGVALLKDRELSAVHAAQAIQEATRTESDRSRRCGASTKSGPCVRPLSHPHGHMSQVVYEKKKGLAKDEEPA